MLNTIVEAKKMEVEKLRKVLDTSNIDINAAKFDPAVFSSRENGAVGIIAEVKQSSPLKGVLCKSFEPLTLARSYEENGAAAISVITDKEFFAGSEEYLTSVKREVRIPVLRKDFIIDELQLYQSMQLGADMVLLIAALHDYKSLLFLSEKSLALGMEPLVEIHGQEELEMVLDLPIHIIGINNRNLRDFQVDIKASLDLVDKIPDRFIKVSESGIKMVEDMRMLDKCGFDMALIGETLVSSLEPGAKLYELANYHRGDDLT